VGKITIRFIGLAVHLDRGPEIDAGHRIVLLSNPEGEVILEHPIEPHRPQLHFPTHARLELEQVTVRIPNAHGSRFEKEHETFDLVPRLTFEGSTPLPLDLGVVSRHQAPAAVYFDTDHGLLSACQTPHGAIGTRLEVETNGLPELLVTSFSGVHRSHFHFEHDEVFLTISNMAVDEKDDAFDFLLSYRVLRELPMKPFIPVKTDSGLPLCGAIVGGDLGPACSNSSYP